MSEITMKLDCSEDQAATVGALPSCKFIKYVKAWGRYLVVGSDTLEADIAEALEETKPIQPQLWAIVELIEDNRRVAGKVEKPGEWGGVIRVDVPTDDGGYRTESYEMSAIYSIELVSEEVARAAAKNDTTGDTVRWYTWEEL